MNLWLRHDEKALRQALRYRARKTPSLRKKLRQAPKAIYYRPVLCLIHKILLYVCFFVVFPLLFFLWVLKLPAETDMAAVMPYALTLMALSCASVFRFRLRTGPEIMLALNYPLRADTAFRCGARNGMIDILGFLCGATVFLGFVMFVRLLDTFRPSGLYALHIPALLATIPLFLKPCSRPLRTGLWIALPGLFAATLFLDRLPETSVSLLLAGRMVLPNGWAQFAILAFEKGDLVRGIGWLAPIMALTVPAALLIRAERRLFVHALETCEPYGETSQISLSGPSETAPALGWGHAEWLERLARAALPDGQAHVIELMCAGTIAWTKRWRRGLYFAAAGMAAVFLPHELWSWTGCMLAAIGVLAATPVMGGVWPGLAGPVAPHGTALLLAVLPVCLRRAVGAAVRTNLIRHMTALPHWAVLGWTVGKATASPAPAFLAAGLFWLSLAAWLPAVTLLNLTQRGVVCARGRWWRLPLAMAALLVWLPLAVTAHVLAVSTAMGGTPPAAWFSVALAMGAVGTVLSQCAVRQIDGKAFDHLIVLPRTAFSG